MFTPEVGCGPISHVGKSSLGAGMPMQGTAVRDLMYVSRTLDVELIQPIQASHTGDLESMTPQTLLTDIDELLMGAISISEALLSCHLHRARRLSRIIVCQAQASGFPSVKEAAELLVSLLDPRERRSAVYYGQAMAQLSQAIDQSVDWRLT